MSNFSVGDVLAKHLKETLSAAGFPIQKKINVLKHRVTPKGRKLALEIPFVSIAEDKQEEFDNLLKALLWYKYAMTATTIKHSQQEQAFSGSVLIQIDGPLDVPNLSVDHKVLIERRDNIIDVANQP